jgi:hypothetical protein
MDITVRSLSSKPREAPPEVLFLVCLFRRMALEKPKAKLTRLFRLGDLFQWKATKKPKQTGPKQYLNYTIMHLSTTTKNKLQRIKYNKV